MTPAEVLNELLRKGRIGGWQGRPHGRTLVWGRFQSQEEIEQLRGELAERLGRPGQDFEIVPDDMDADGLRG